MRDATGAGLTYEVVVEELTRAARDVAAITESAKEGTLEALPTTISTVGDDDLAAALRDFCARWDTGLSHLVGDATEMSRRLAMTAQSYTEESWAAAQSFDAAHARPTPTWSVPAPVPGWGGATWTPLTGAPSTAP